MPHDKIYPVSPTLKVFKEKSIAHNQSFTVYNHRSNQFKSYHFSRKLMDQGSVVRVVIHFQGELVNQNKGMLILLEKKIRNLTKML